MTKRHMSTDIETLDVENDAAVIAIGAVIFTVNGDAMESFEVLIDPILTPGSRDRDTWNWWQQQDEAVRTKMLSGTTTPWDACLQFAAFCTNNVDIFWGNPARFDYGHIRSLFKAVGMPYFPFKFYQERDLPTLKEAATAYPELKEELREIKKANTAAHDALADAIAQAKMIQAIMKKLRIE